jgi:excinuclease ABC subunit C
MNEVDWEIQRGKLLARAKELPTGPGVYTFLNDKEKPVYIGKAANLRSRVSSYFRRNADDGRPLFPFIITSTVTINFLITDSPKDALLLENNLIKEHKPRFNVMLTDDKTYLSLKISTHEKWPRLNLVRRATKDKARYFGPYASASEARDLARIVKKNFALRTCSNLEFKQRTRPCLEYQMGRCGAPCVDYQTEEEYSKIVEDVILFLKGKNDELLPRLEERMKEFSSKLQFEQAARVRDEIKAMKGLHERRNVARTGVFKNQDAFGVAQIGATTIVRVLHVRYGRISNSTVQKIETHLPQDIVLNAFLSQFYDGTRPIPEEILLPQDIEDRELLSQVLSEKCGRKVKFMVPKRGSRASLVAMAMKNAAAHLNTETERREALTKTLEALEDGLQLPNLPEIVECYDISTIQGHFTVASMVRFEHGEARRDRFRTYRINSVEGQDDFASMREVLSRRFDPAKVHRLGKLPNLVVIDGGKGQLGVAHSVISNLVESYPQGQMTVVGLAKARVKKASVTQERVFFPGRSTPVVMPQDSPELLFLARVRDAAHDHAINYHRELRRKKMLKSGLDEIPGVGPSRKKALLRHFGKLSDIKKANLETLEAAPGIPMKVAKAVFKFFQEN